MVSCFAKHHCKGNSPPTAMPFLNVERCLPQPAQIPHTQTSTCTSLSCLDSWGAMEVHAVQCIYFIIKKSTDPLLIDHGVQSQNAVWKSEVELISPLQKHFSQSFGHAIIHSCEHGLRHTQHHLHHRRSECPRLLCSLWCWLVLGHMTM